MAISRESLVAYLENEHGVDAADLTDDAPLFSGGLLDSFSLVDLILFIEKGAGFKMNPTEVSLDNLDSIERILGFVAARA